MKHAYIMNGWQNEMANGWRLDAYECAQFDGMRLQLCCVICWFISCVCVFASVWALAQPIDVFVHTNRMNIAPDFHQGMCVLPKHKLHRQAFESQNKRTEIVLHSRINTVSEREHKQSNERKKEKSFEIHQVGSRRQYQMGYTQKNSVFYYSNFFFF